MNCSLLNNEFFLDVSMLPLVCQLSKVKYVCNWYIKLDKIDGSSTRSSVEQQSTSSRSAAQMGLFSRVVKIFKFILIAPATNAVSERSCLALQRTKNLVKNHYDTGKTE